MAPDLNSVPASPRGLLGNDSNPNTGPAVTPRRPSQQNSGHGAAQGQSAATSRRASQIFPMSPPPLPLATPGGSSTQAEPHRTPAQSQQAFPPFVTSPVSAMDGTGLPMRHPRPLTAAELHLELEKEQEAVVNRLTRELTALRAHSASVASTTSTTSSAAPLPPDASTSRRHRSSSSISRGSFSHGIPLNPATSSIPHYHRHSLSRTHTTDGEGGPQGMTRTVSTQRFEEAAQARSELEEAKRENETLRQRVRELEGLVRRNRREREGAEGTGTVADG